jgi:NADPH2:quinone reductase
MRAYGFVEVGGPEREAFLEVPVPVPGPEELLVRVRSAGVNPGDWRLREGGYGTVGPAVLGREVAGVVEQVGADVRGFSAGDEVFGGCPGMVGGWAEYALVQASFAAPRPASVSSHDAAVLPVAAGTAFDALTNLDLPRGATLLVNGAGGGVGVAIVQLASAAGLVVIGTASPAKHALISAYGGMPVAYGDGVLDRILAVAPGKIDAVFDLVGGDALRAVATLPSDPAQVLSVADKDLAKRLGGREIVRDRSSEVLRRLVGLVAEGALSPHVTNVFPLDRAGDALALVEHGHAAGKVVIEVAD